MVVNAQTYEEFALEHPDEAWELHDGQLREKPAVSYGHSNAVFQLVRQLDLQLDPDEFRVRANFGRVRRSTASYYIPDLYVIPFERISGLLDRPDLLEVYADPLPLVVEVWSPSTGGYEVDGKRPEYQARGDLEIWRIHPYDRTLTAWRRQPDGSYVETTYRGGHVPIAALPGVTVELEALFA